MRFSKAILPIALCIILLSLAVPAQKRKGRAAKPPFVGRSHRYRGAQNSNYARTQLPLLVNFWATYCDPCRDEFPELVKIDKDYRPRAMEFITISLDDVMTSKLRAEVSRSDEGDDAGLSAQRLGSGARH